jgi:anti-sigma factor RsiW
MVLSLNENEILRLTRARGTTVEVLDGCVWITEAGRERDAVVSSGARYSVGGNGLVVIGMDAGAGGVAGISSRIAVWPPVWRWLQVRAGLIAKRFADGLEERRTLRELEGLSDYSLRDIGVRRDQIASAARGGDRL